MLDASVLRGQVFLLGMSRLLLRVEVSKQVVLGIATAAVHRMTEMSSASGISPIITSTSDSLVDDALASAARPPSPAEIEPSSAAVSRSSPGDAFCKASPTWPGSDAGPASSERGVSPCDTGSSETLCGESLVMTENYPLRQN